MSDQDELVDLTIVLPQSMSLRLHMEAQELGMLPAELAGLILSGAMMFRGETYVKLGTRPADSRDDGDVSASDDD
jgi:hypothetical protein